MTDEEAQMKINQEHDQRTRRDRIVGMMICGIILLWTLAFCSSAHAQTACAWNEDCLTWDRATVYQDGSPLLATDVLSYDIEAQMLLPIVSSVWVKVGTVNAPIQAFRRTGLKNGETWQYRITQINVGDYRAPPSNTLSATTVLLPGPATLKSVQ
jgi:hypothetical protein